MKILILNYEHPPIGGGGGRVSQNLAEEWVKAGHQVDVVTSHYKSLPKYEKQLGFNLYRVPILGRKDLYSATFFSMFCFSVSGFLKSFQLCFRNKYDIINTHFAIPTGPIGVLLSKIFKIKNVLELHGGDIYNPNYKIKPQENFFLKKIIKFILNNSTKIVAHSQDIKYKAYQFYNPNKEIDIIPIGFKQFDFRKTSRQELYLDKNKFYLISVSRLVLRKRIDKIINAIAKLNDLNIALLIVGKGPEKENLENLVFRLNLKNQVHFLGFVSEEKKFQYLSCADAFISTSEHEGFGINFQEARSCNLPIIATDCKGVIDTYENSIYNFEDNNIKFIINLIKNNKLQYKQNTIPSVKDISEKYLNIFR